MTSSPQQGPASHPHSPLRVVIASALEVGEVERIAACFPGRISLAYEPDLLPVPRYVADHNGTKRTLTETQRSRWRELLAEADILFDFDWEEPARLPERAPRLRWVQATSAGIGEFLDRNGLVNSPILFTTAAGAHAGPLAEFVLLGLLYFTKRVTWLQGLQAEHRWQHYASRELSGQRMLVVGLGAIGREIARVCAAMGVEVWATKRTDAVPPPGVTRLVPVGGIAGVLPRMDILVLACPLTRETHHLIGAKELAALPNSAIVINVGRGAVIDEPAMIAALREGRLAGAALDVFEHEPLPADNPLWAMPNVLISPHSASTVEAENRRIVDIFIANLERFLEQRPLLNEFRRERGY
jgi:glyoxylate/hydroxypyruvate reductase